MPPAPGDRFPWHLARKCLAAPPNGGEARPAYVTRDEPLFTIILRRHHGCVKNQRPLII